MIAWVGDNKIKIMSWSHYERQTDALQLKCYIPCMNMSE